MSRKVFHRLVPPSKVMNVVESFMKLGPVGVEEVPISRALGRVLAEDVTALWDAPPFDRSEVDGYAVVSLSVEGAEEDRPVKLRVKGSVRIGEVPSIEVGLGEAVEIDTGAVLPRGADSVIMVEYTKKEGGYVYVFRSAAPGDNVARAGSDIIRGEILLREGTLLGVGEIASLAAVGVSTVKVFKKPRIAIYSIGNELIEPGNPLRGAEIYNVNAYSVSAALSDLGAEPVFKGVLPDDQEAIRAEFSKTLKEFDALIASGGTSAGVGDLTYRVLDELGEPGVIIHGLRQKPGKPTVISVIDGKLAIGLPGFPLSCLMALRNAVAPLIAKLSGLRLSYLRPWLVRARLSERLTGVRGKELLIPAVLIKRKDELIAYPIRVKSGSTYVLTFADGFIKLPEEIHVLNEGDEVQVELFRKGWNPPDLVVIGSHDYLLERLVLKEVGKESIIKLVPAGSTKGLLSAASGLADVGGSHLLDPVTGEYNVPYVSKLGAEGKVYVVRGWVREIGFVVKPGNPKGISGFKDLLRKDVVFINRNKGSGTRTYIDLKLKELSDELSVPMNKLVKGIKGYTNEVKTHTGVAAAVASGRADLGVAVKHAAKLYGLQFIKLTEEKYDLIVSRESWKKPLVKQITNLLKNEEIKKIVEDYEGYRTTEETGETIYEPN